jgi:uncharacterized protein YjbJ (UPF0337 family)
VRPTGLLALGATAAKAEVIATSAVRLLALWGNRKPVPDEKGSAMGIIDKITGRAKKAAGDIADDASLRRQGKREERKGEKKEELDRVQEKADEKAEEVADLERKT